MLIIQLLHKQCLCVGGGGWWGRWPVSFPELEGWRVWCLPSLATCQSSKATVKACATVKATAWAWRTGENTLCYKPWLKKSALVFVNPRDAQLSINWIGTMIGMIFNMSAISCQNTFWRRLSLLMQSKDEVRKSVNSWPARITSVFDATYLHRWRMYFNQTVDI